MDTDKLKIVINSDTEPTFVVGKKGLEAALKIFWKKKRGYKVNKLAFILNLFWAMAIWFMPFKEEWMRYALAAGWVCLLLHAFRNMYLYEKYCKDEEQSFLNELKKQPWR